MISLLDPRRHLAAAIGWSLLVVVALASLVAARLAAGEAEDAARAGTERLLTQFATQVERTLTMTLRNRLAIVQATAAQIAVSGDKGEDALRLHLDAVRAQFPEFAWMGVADAHGTVVAATGGLLQGQSVAQQPWFVAAQSRARLLDVHEAEPLRALALGAPGGGPPRVVDAAAPIVDDGKPLAGVVGAHLAWAWIERLQADLLGALDTRRQLDLLLADGAGTVVVGPPAWLGRRLGAPDDPSEGGAYLVGRHRDADAAGDGLGWQVVVRQPAALALAPADRLRRTVFWTVLLAGVAAGLAALAVTHALTRRLASLAAQAAAVRRGESAGITPPPGVDEVSRIGAALSQLVAHLQQEKAALARLNAELDARVVERTARIERLADEARHAAVTRERLRLARDLHDTLAHSLMALLTQLRLVRKLRGRMSSDELGAELDRAESVAASGLAEARAAIVQMRHGTVRETGLAAALRDLVSRFAERTGVAANLQARGWAADLADERAETVYRIVEEALRNVERHAQARSVSVEIGEAPGRGPAPPGTTGAEAVVSVRDDGAGFDPGAPREGHFGMLGMREQAALIGAELVVRSAPGQGTELRLSLPA